MRERMAELFISKLPFVAKTVVKRYKNNKCDIQHAVLYANCAYKGRRMHF